MVLAASAASEAAPGVLGFLVVAGMGLILYFLFRSMAKHLRNVSAPRQGTVAAARVATGDGASDARANGSAVPDGITRAAAEHRSAKDSGAGF